MTRRKISRQALRIDEVKFVSASSADVATGLLGWAACTINGTLRLDSLAIRRTLDGRLVVSFPGRRDGSGQLHPYVRPLDDASRCEIETQIFRALGLEEVPRR